MKKYIYKASMLALFAGVLFTSCEPEVDYDANPSSGEADLSTYVALGNSLTAGFQDGALYREGQQVSYPAILAEQFELAGGSDVFRQPLMAEGVSAGSPNITASGIEVPKRLVLAPSTDCKGVTSLAPTSTGKTDYSAFAPTTEQGPFNNLGVPGAKAIHLLAPGYGDPAGVAVGTANPYFTRFASSTTTSVIADALAQNPTFFTLWIGNNDVLGYATAGGVGTSPTDPAQFAGYINLIVSRLISNGAKGAIANIPDIDKIPYFTTIPINGLQLTAQQAQQLTGAYAQMGLTSITFKEGANNFVVNEDGVVRQLKQGERLLLTVPQDQLKCQGLGSMTPIDDKYVLSETELATIQTAIDNFNNTLKAAAETNKLAYVDINAYLDRLANGIKIDEVTYTPALVTGNVFSLDGIHFTPRAAALVANEFIQAINKKYNANVPTVNVTNYRTVVFP